MNFQEIKWKLFRLKYLALRPFKNGIAKLFIRKTQQTNFVFIFGHMRSRSSLLAHILANHTEIVGIGETNRVYGNDVNFAKQVLACAYHEKSMQVFNKYILDQVNHNHMTPQEPLLLNYRIKYILLARPPKPAIESMMTAFGQQKNRPFSLQNAIEHYEKRLQFLLDFKKSKDQDTVLIIHSDELIERSHETLKRISQFLCLNKVLEPEYAIHDYTGKRGDTTPSIFKGAISKETTIKSFKLNDDITKLDILFQTLMAS